MPDSVSPVYIQISISVRARIMRIIMCFASLQNRDFLLKRNSWARRNMKKPKQRISIVTWNKEIHVYKIMIDKVIAYCDVERQRKIGSTGCWFLKNGQSKNYTKCQVEDACKPPALVSLIHVDCRDCWLKFHVGSRPCIIQVGSCQENLNLIWNNSKRNKFYNIFIYRPTFTCEHVH